MCICGGNYVYCITVGNQFFNALECLNRKFTTYIFKRFSVYIKDTNKFDIFFDKGVYELAYVAYDCSIKTEVPKNEEQNQWDQSILVVLTKYNGE